MRLYGIHAADVETVVGNAWQIGRDDKGNRRLVGPDDSGRAIIVIVAHDDPRFVITTFPDD